VSNPIQPGEKIMQTPSTFDANRAASVLNLTQEEIDDIHEQIHAGLLPPDYLERCAEARARNTFGADAKKDRAGNFIEQGLGSEYGMTRNSIEAYKRYHSQDFDFEKNVAKMEKQLIAANERRKAEAAAAPRGAR
jgi:hypothetical protein